MTDSRTALCDLNRKNQTYLHAPMQVNLCKKHLFLDQLTHNLTRLFIDLPVQYMKTTSSGHGYSILRGYKALMGTFWTL